MKRRNFQVLLLEKYTNEKLHSRLWILLHVNDLSSSALSNFSLRFARQLASWWRFTPVRAGRRWNYSREPEIKQSLTTEWVSSERLVFTVAAWTPPSSPLGNTFVTLSISQSPLLLFITRSQIPPKCGSDGGENFQVIPWLINSAATGVELRFSISCLIFLSLPWYWCRCHCKSP